MDYEVTESVLKMDAVCNGNDKDLHVDVICVLL